MTHRTAGQLGVDAWANKRQCHEVPGIEVSTASKMKIGMKRNNLPEIRVVPWYVTTETHISLKIIKTINGLASRKGQQQNIKNKYLA